MAHRFPIAEIIESWGGNYTVQAEVVLSKYHYHQIRMKGWSGSSTTGWRRPRGEASRHSSLTLHLSQCPHLAPTSMGQPYITLTQTRWWGGGGRSPKHNHSSVRDKAYDEGDTTEKQTDKQGDDDNNNKMERRLSAELVQGSHTWRFSVFFGSG